MKFLAEVLFWLGLISIPLSWVMWYFGARVEIARHVLADIADPALKAALKEAHAERWGLFIGLWPVTLFVLSYLIEQRVLG
ncbi:MAG: hypothetical protein A2Y50_11020 [Pseudomonadales bacterium RIFCSPLOWO2_12_59_9]|jgi:hypothetical protein|nr:MAG: hypothetical protein A2Y50_11020 [Pseudomonadales bacterium RIFCSPLOWO2_12_59_9]